MRSIHDSRKNLLSIIILHQRLLYLRNKRKKIIIRRNWVKPFLKDRDSLGAYKNIFLYFKENDHPEFKKLTRMSVRQFDLLHRLIQGKLVKNSPREPVSTEIRLAAVVV